LEAHTSTFFAFPWEIGETGLRKGVETPQLGWLKKISKQRYQLEITPKYSNRREGERKTLLLKKTALTDLKVCTL
jgi:hypothetical protein